MATKKKSSSKSDRVYLREVEIRYRKRRVSGDAALGRPFRGAEKVVSLFSDMQNESKEKMVTLYLDTKYRVMCYEMVALGNLNAIFLRPMEVFRTAFAINASSAIVIHNHPSGDPKPSPDDRALTKTLRRMSSDMGLDFLDHIIIAEDGYYSFAEHGKM